MGKKYHPYICADVYGLSDDFLKQFDFIWLSPDCTTYSIAQHGIHRTTGGVPVSDYAKWCDKKNRELFARLKKLDIPFIIENPSAFMHLMDFTKDFYIKKIYYSGYGGLTQKPTDFFSNRKELLEIFKVDKQPNKMVYDRIPSNKFLDRCKMPELLIQDIVLSVKKYFKLNEGE